MADPLSAHGPKAPARRVRDLPGDGYYFPGEVADLLGVRAADYHQLRRLFRLVRRHSATPVPAGDRSWSRYTLTDIAAIQVALAICGGPEVLAHGRRLRLAPLERACQALSDLGIANPLLDVRLQIQGRQVLASIDGVVFDPVTGQTALSDVLRLLTPTLGDEPQASELRGLLRAESRRLPRKASAPKATGQQELI